MHDSCCMHTPCWHTGGSTAQTKGSGAQWRLHLRPLCSATHITAQSTAWDADWRWFAQLLLQRITEFSAWGWHHEKHDEYCTRSMILHRYRIARSPCGVQLSHGRYPTLALPWNEQYPTPHGNARKLLLRLAWYPTRHRIPPRHIISYRACHPAPPTWCPRPCDIPQHGNDEYCISNHDLLLRTRAQRDT